METEEKKEEGKYLFSASLKLDDTPLQKLAGCLSFDCYNITMRIQCTKEHLGKFLDFLLNAEWKDQWGTISIEEILKIETTKRPEPITIDET